MTLHFRNTVSRIARIPLTRWIALCVMSMATMLVSHTSASAQNVRIRDLTITDGSTPTRLLGYGIVVGLDGTGDRGVNGRSGGQTVQSIANLLRRFDIEIPAEVLRTRNAAAVLVTAEVSPYLRPGGRFEVNIASLGDARSLRGGTLWMTPLVTDAGTQAMATAQGSIVMSDGNINSRDLAIVETSGRIPNGGLLEAEIARTSFASTSKLFLKEPDIGTAIKIANAINQAIGEHTAVVDDPGVVQLAFTSGTNAGADRAATLVRIQELTITPDRANRLIIDGRDGTVVAGGTITVSNAVVSHGGITLTIGGTETGAARPKSGESGAPAEGSGGTQAVRVQNGASVQAVASALQAVQTSPAEIAAIFESLRAVGALVAEVSVR